jgi:PAS domain S-box-containing protein
VSMAGGVPGDSQNFVEFIGRLKETETLLAVARSLSLGLPAPETMRLVAREVARAFAADMVGAYTIDAGQALTPIGGYHVPKDLVDWFRSTPFRIGASDALLAAAETLKPVWTLDAATDGRWIPDVGVLPPHSALFAPTVSNGALVGGLFLIWWTRGRTPSQIELSLLEGVTSQVGLALELRRQTDERLRERDVFAELVKSINTSLDLDTVLQRVSEAARDLTGGDIARIALRDETSDTMAFRYLVGARYAHYDRIRIERGKGMGGVVWNTGRPQRTDNSAGDPAFSRDYLALVRAEGIVATVAVPIRVGATVEGLIYVDARSPRHFSEHDEAMLVRLADHAASAIHNARLYEEMKRAHQFLELVAANSADIIVRMDGRGRLTYASPGSETLLGVPLDQVVGRPASDFLHGGEAEARRFMRHVVTEGQVRDLETVLVVAGGRLADTRHSLAAIRDASGAVVEIVDIIRDVTEAKRLENQLQQAQKMEAVGQLAGGIAHDFNNLLTIVTGRSELLLHRLRADDPIRPDLALIKSTGERAAALTGQLLAFSRRQVLQPRVLRLNGVVQDVAPMLRRLIGEHISLVTVLAPDLHLVKADATQLDQVIVNLAVNARDAMQGGGRLTLETSNMVVDEGFVARHPGSRLGRHVALTVTDTGAGMDPVVQSRMFEPFFTTKEPGKGTGLGLAMVYGIVKQHDGYIAVDSEPGRGTRFLILLPRVDDDVTDATAAAATTAHPASATVLLVEDEEGVRAVATDMLAAAGYRVLEAATPGEALRVFGSMRTEIDLLLTDVVMPEMSGRDLANRLLALKPGLKVLFMSGYTDDAIAHHGVLVAANNLISKPFSGPALQAAVTRTLFTR